MRHRAHLLWLWLGLVLGSGLELGLGLGLVCVDALTRAQPPFNVP